jgi:competence protein ComEC
MPVARWRWPASVERPARGQRGNPGVARVQLQAQPCVSGEQLGVGRRACSSCGNGRTPATVTQKSCVLQVQAGDERLLLTGDIDAQAERALLAHAAGGPTCIGCKLPHHGSRTSSSWVFLQRWLPKAVSDLPWGEAMVSVIRTRRWWRVTRRWACTVYDSAEQGAVRLRLGAFDGAGPGQRSKRRFWRAPDDSDQRPVCDMMRRPERRASLW